MNLYYWKRGTQSWEGGLLCFSENIDKAIEYMKAFEGIDDIEKKDVKEIIPYDGWIYNDELR